MLFTDPVGLTALRGRLGEEAAEDLRREHDRMLTQTIEANSWRVVKNLGDGIKGTFAGAPDGVAAARAIQQAIERHTPAWQRRRFAGAGRGQRRRCDL